MWGDSERAPKIHQLKSLSYSQAFSLDFLKKSARDSVEATDNSSLDNLSPEISYNDFSQYSSPDSFSDELSVYELSVNELLRATNYHSTTYSVTIFVSKQVLVNLT